MDTWRKNNTPYVRILAYVADKPIPNNRRETCLKGTTYKNMSAHSFYPGIIFYPYIIFLSSGPLEEPNNTTYLGFYEIMSLRSWQLAPRLCLANSFPRQNIYRGWGSINTSPHLLHCQLLFTSIYSVIYYSAYQHMYLFLRIDGIWTFFLAEFILGSRIGDLFVTSTILPLKSIIFTLLSQILRGPWPSPAPT